MRPSKRQRPERVLSWIVPLRPYRCNACDHRQFGRASPILNRPRIITYSVAAALLVGLIVLSTVRGGE